MSGSHDESSDAAIKSSEYRNIEENQEDSRPRAVTFGPGVVENESGGNAPAKRRKSVTFDVDGDADKAADSSYSDSDDDDGSIETGVAGTNSMRLYSNKIRRKFSLTLGVVSLEGIAAQYKHYERPDEEWEEKSMATG